MPDNREIWERIGAVERQIDELFKHLDLEKPEPPGADDVSPKVLKLAQSGDKAKAAQQYRKETGTSLADAVAVVERIAG